MPNRREVIQRLIAGTQGPATTTPTLPSAETLAFQAAKAPLPAITTQWASGDKVYYHPKEMREITVRYRAYTPSNTVSGTVDAPVQAVEKALWLPGIRARGAKSLSVEAFSAATWLRRMGEGGLVEIVQIAPWREQRYVRPAELGGDVLAVPKFFSLYVLPTRVARPGEEEIAIGMPGAAGDWFITMSMTIDVPLLIEAAWSKRVYRTPAGAVEASAGVEAAVDRLIAEAEKELRAVIPEEPKKAAAVQGFRTIGLSNETIRELARQYFATRIVAALEAIKAEHPLTRHTSFRVSGPDYSAILREVRGLCDQLYPQIISALQSATQSTLEFARGLISASYGFTIRVMNAPSHKEAGFTINYPTHLGAGKRGRFVPVEGQPGRFTIEGEPWLNIPDPGNAEIIYTDPKDPKRSWRAFYSEPAAAALIRGLDVAARPVVAAASLGLLVRPEFFAARIRDEIGFMPTAWKPAEEGFLAWKFKVWQELEARFKDKELAEKKQKLARLFQNFDELFKAFGVQLTRGELDSHRKSLETLTTQPTYQALWTIAPAIEMLVSSYRSLLANAWGWAPPELPFEPEVTPFMPEAELAPPPLVPWAPPTPEKVAEEVFPI